MYVDFRVALGSPD